MVFPWERFCRLSRCLNRMAHMDETKYEDVVDNNGISEKFNNQG